MTGESGQHEKQAAALRYSGWGAPVIIASGSGQVAERILSVAREHEIPLRQDPQLTELLCQLPLGDEIPEILYLAVAEILAYVFKMNALQQVSINDHA